MKVLVDDFSRSRLKRSEATSVDLPKERKLSPTRPTARPENPSVKSELPSREKSRAITYSNIQALIGCSNIREFIEKQSLPKTHRDPERRKEGLGGLICEAAPVCARTSRSPRNPLPVEHAPVSDLRRRSDLRETCLQPTEVESRNPLHQISSRFVFACLSDPKAERVTPSPHRPESRACVSISVRPESETRSISSKISKDHLRLIKVLMGLRPEYESVRAALLHCSPLPSLDAAIQEILFEEKRLGINLSKHSDVVLASTYSPPGASSTFCKNCKLTGHKFIDCPKIECRAKNFTKPRNSSVVAATLDNPTTPQFQISDLQSLLNQLISSSSSTLAISSGNRWLLDSACCNHMTSNYSLMNTPSPAKSLPLIYAADGNCMNITHIGTVQDPQTGQTIGTGRKVGRLFELLSLQVPSPSSISTPVTDSDTYQWHLRLGHASPEKALLFSAPAPTLLKKMDVPSANIATFLTHSYIRLYRLPSSVLQNISPFEKLYGTPPNYSNLKTFGCACFVLLHPHEHTKLEPRARFCCFLGYGTEHKGFRCWDPLSNRLRISRHVTFWEHTMFSRLSSFHTSFSSPQPFFTDTSIDLFPPSESPLRNELAQSAPTSAISDQSSISDGSPEPTPDTPHRRSTGVREPPIHLQDYHCFSTIISLVEPTSYQEASTDPLWQKAMNDELQALEKTHTWDYVDLPPGKRPIGCKWIYKIKTHSDGTIERYKARLVAKGYSQEYGIDYEETFALVARMTSLRSLLAVAAAKQ
ncbi:retrotransposon protein [Cucumis melo var. makuwa]|uniref:Retrotransposon protein n=1 Tax=Cucumis melo var. makuwa TaxID=1194695 RepID=A0A5A7VLK0_CUCMM|nr:retrotransposon protein [Cucumis melo var. makuwa]